MSKKKETKKEEVITKAILQETLAVAFDEFAKKWDFGSFVKKSDLVILEVKIDAVDLKVDHLRSDFEEFKSDMNAFKTEMNAFRMETHENFLYMGSLWERHEKRIERLEVERV